MKNYIHFKPVNDLLNNFQFIFRIKKNDLRYKPLFKVEFRELFRIHNKK